MGLSMSVVAGVAPEPTGNVVPLTSSQRKRIKQFLKKQKTDPRHSQINLEGYLLLPVQRVPRYKLMVCNRLLTDVLAVLTDVVLFV